MSTNIEARLSALGFIFRTVRGKPMIEDNRGGILVGALVDDVIDDTPVCFYRRRYSNTTFTWVSALIDGDWVNLGDPWQAITPKRAEIIEEIAKRRRSAVEAVN